MTNIILNFVLNKLISVTDNVPLWVTKKLRNYWKAKSELHKLNISYNRRKGDYEEILNMTTNITEESSISKKNYFNNLSEKLCYLKFHQKDYWGIFKSFKPIEKKFPSTPLLLINYHFVTNFNEKKCSLIKKHQKIFVEQGSHNNIIVNFC